MVKRIVIDLVAAMFSFSSKNVWAHIFPSNERMGMLDHQAVSALRGYLVKS